MQDVELKKSLEDFYEGFVSRHLGLNQNDQAKILDLLQKPDLEDFLSSVIPSEIFDKTPPVNFLPSGCDENHALQELEEIVSENQIKRSLIGLGYHGTAIPSSIKRYVLENPAWYTAYTPYQAEIAQGRLEALFNFQTLISELTGLPIANASLLDEATAVAEAMTMSFSLSKRSEAKRFLVDQDVLPQTLEVLRTRAEPLGIDLELINCQSFKVDQTSFGVFLQLPGRSGRLWDPSEIISICHENSILVTVGIDPLAQVLIEPVGYLGADIAVGSMQRFGVPIGFGGPHAAFLSTKESFKRNIPGRLVGQSVDKSGNNAWRLALQTREQHIRRDKATSNICTAQVLLAVISCFYAMYHGPEGLELIAKRVVIFRQNFEDYLVNLGYKIDSFDRFDTIELECRNAPLIHELALKEGINLRILPFGKSIEQSTGVGISFDELTNEKEFLILQKIFHHAAVNYEFSSINLDSNFSFDSVYKNLPLRKQSWLRQAPFNTYTSETKLMRYINNLAGRDFSLVNGMIPLGSCTMKLNSAAELSPITWKKFNSIHPFSPQSQVIGYEKLINDLELWLANLTGLSGVSLQPNAGSQGEFAGLLVIRAWHHSRSEGHRNICLIPNSAHGTNPASSVMAGFKVIAVNCDKHGNIDFNDLNEKVRLHSSNLAALMVTYPSTHGVFEPGISDICKLVHSHGGQVYLDGANFNAQVGLCRPGNYGIDVCHLNLHKTFCIPHGGGGPGVGPIAVAKHLLPYLPGHPLVKCGGGKAIGSVSAAPYGSACILPISWMYIRMMGFEGLRKASSIALLSANYISKRLNPYFQVLYKGIDGFVAHECILDLRPVKKETGINVEDIAKRLMDYGFHAPTINWPVTGTLMIEPTESESLEEINRFCDAMIAIHAEIEVIKEGDVDLENSPLRQSPHTLAEVASDTWNRSYSREQAAFPMDDQVKNKFWPSVSRIDNAFGDRNLICSCPSVEDLKE